MNKPLPAISLLLSDARGIYIPRDFAAGFDTEAWCVNPADAEALSDPDNEWYWEAWQSVLDKARYTDEAGNVYTLHQDGDLWALCAERMTDEEKANFGFEE
jgi:hypothetical protein